MDTIREQIIQNIETRCATISTTATSPTFNFDYDNIFRARKNIEIPDLPCMVVWPGQDTDAQKQYGRTKCEMTIKIEAFRFFDTTNPSVIQEQMLGDVISAFTDPENPFPLIEDISYTNGGPEDFPSGGETITGIGVTFNIQYSYKTGKPYTQ